MDLEVLHPTLVTNAHVKNVWIKGPRLLWAPRRTSAPRSVNSWQITSQSSQQTKTPSTEMQLGTGHAHQQNGQIRQSCRQEAWEGLILTMDLRSRWVCYPSIDKQMMDVWLNKGRELTKHYWISQAIQKLVDSASSSSKLTTSKTICSQANSTTRACRTTQKVSSLEVLLIDLSPNNSNQLSLILLHLGQTTNLSIQCTKTELWHSPISTQWMQGKTTSILAIVSNKTHF